MALYEVQLALRALAEAGDPLAMRALGDLLEQHFGEMAPRELGAKVTRRQHLAHREATAWWERAAAAGDTEAMIRLGDLLRADREGNIEATFMLGYQHALHGRAKDAEHWYRRAAEGGHVKAASNLAFMLDKQARASEAEPFYRQAAESAQGGDTTYRFLLAHFLAEQGRYDEAIQEYRPAAEAGDLVSMEALASIFDARGDTQMADHWRKQLESAPRVPGGGAGGLVEIIATALVTAFVYQFVQQVAAKAASDSYDAVRSRLMSIFRRHRTRSGGDSQNKVLIVRDPTTGLRLIIRPDATDESIRKLANVDLAKAALGSSKPSGPFVLVWNEPKHEWEIH